MVQNWEAQGKQSRSTNAGGGMMGKGRGGGAGLGGRNFDRRCVTSLTWSPYLLDGVSTFKMGIRWKKGCHSYHKSSILLTTS